jgi:hypothetical protein
MFKDCFHQYNRHVLFPLYVQSVEAKLDDNLPLQMITELMYDDACQAYLDVVDMEAREIWATWNNQG